MQEIKKSNVTIRSDYPIYKRHRYEIWPRHIGNIYIERGNQKSLDTKLSINGTDIEEFDSGETYACLGQDEDIGFKWELDKQRVTKEYLRRVRQIWNSELYSRNKVLAQNIFAIPVLTPTFGMLEWTKQKLEDLDIKQKKHSQHVPAFIPIAI